MAMGSMTATTTDTERDISASTRTPVMVQTISCQGGLTQKLMGGRKCQLIVGLIQWSATTVEL